MSGRGRQPQVLRASNSHGLQLTASAHSTVTYCFWPVASPTTSSSFVFVDQLGPRIWACRRFRDVAHHVLSFFLSSKQPPVTTASDQASNCAVPFFPAASREHISGYTAPPLFRSRTGHQLNDLYSARFTRDGLVG